MKCYKPVRAWQLVDGTVVFKERGDISRSLFLPCSRCIGCRLERSRQWAIRCMHEASLYENNSFVTLTYEKNPITLVYRDFQLFMKRLRKVYPGARFYMCGEYGEKNGRPHFHACLFGVGFPDRKYLCTTASGGKLYESGLLNKLWTHGLTSIGDVTFESAAYVARYCMDTVQGSMVVDPDTLEKRYSSALAKWHYELMDESTGEIIQRKPEFNRMSLRGGIGLEWLKRFHKDVYPHGKVVVDGVEVNPPRYYDKKFEEMDGFAFEDMSHARYLHGIKNAADNTQERLAVREKVTAARVAKLVRNV